jgi:curved DNA-binding protein CbpA
VSDARDPYEVLQVAPTADDAVLRAAYRALAQRFHPDIAGPDGEARMRELNAAWEAIGTPERRAAHHRLRGVSEHGQAAGSTPGAGSSGRPGPSPTADARSAPPGSAPPWTGAAGPPPGHPSGSVLDFGVYYGWSLGEIARQDLGYLQWLEPRAEARSHAAEIDAILRRHGLRDQPTTGATDAPRRGHRIFGR